MPSYGGTTTMRGDYRCLICRQKDVFHCEHDTPYRDRFLVDKELERNQSDSNSGSKRNQQSQGTQPNPSKDPKAAPIKTVVLGAGNTRKQQLPVTTQTTTTNKTPNDKKDKKSCVIL